MQAKHRIFDIILSLGFFLLPIVFWPYSKIQFEVPKVWFVKLWIATLVLVSLPYFLRPARRRLNSKLFTAVMAFLFIALISAIFGSDWQKSFVGNYWRDDGLITFFHLIIFFLLISLFWKDSLKKIISYSIVGGIAVTIVLMITLKINTFGNPILMAGYSSVALPFIYYLYKSTKNYIWLFYLVIVAVITSSLSLGGLVTSLFFIMLLFLHFGTKRKWIKLISVSTLGFIIVALTWWNLQHIGSKSFVAESRSRIFHKLILSYYKKPLIGWGWANVDHAFSASVWPMKFEKDVYLDKAHSELLETLVTTGIVGLILYCSIIFFVFKSLYNYAKKERRWGWNKTIFSVFLLYLLHSQTNIISISEQLLFWTVLGITAGMARSPED